MESEQWVDPDEVIVYERFVRGGAPDGCVEPAMVCPHLDCVSEEFWEVDRAVRWNPVTVDDNNGSLFLAWRSGSDGDGFEHLGYKCQGCERAVTMPAWLDVIYGG